MHVGSHGGEWVEMVRRSQIRMVAGYDGNDGIYVYMESNKSADDAALQLAELHVQFRQERTRQARELPELRQQKMSRIYLPFLPFTVYPEELGTAAPRLQVSKKFAFATKVANMVAHGRATWL
jgi:hypothetical protein